jgi:drug/metabolite transporter superfamily protein YnfA
MEFWIFVRARKKLWLLPLALVMLAFGVLLLLAQSSAISPFIYVLL